MHTWSGKYILCGYKVITRRTKVCIIHKYVCQPGLLTSGANKIVPHLQRLFVYRCYQELWRGISRGKERYSMIQTLLVIRLDGSHCKDISLPWPHCRRTVLVLCLSITSFTPNRSWHRRSLEHPNAESHHGYFLCARSSWTRLLMSSFLQAGISSAPSLTVMMRTG